MGEVIELRPHTEKVQSRLWTADDIEKCSCFTKGLNDKQKELIVRFLNRVDERKAVEVQ